MGIRSERRLCDEVHLNLAYRWFCRLDLTDPVPDHSTFSKNRHGRFRDSDLLRHLFETVDARCIGEDLVGGERPRRCWTGWSRNAGSRRIVRSSTSRSGRMAPCAPPASDPTFSTKRAHKHTLPAGPAKVRSRVFFR